MTETVSADYLVIGAGAMGMAFVDTLLTDSSATIAIVDKYYSPGGHWTTAYPFVRLHQPSTFYGVNSRPLGRNAIDKIGWNSGLFELATCHEVCDYYKQVMNQDFLPSGRVQYFPKCEYTSDCKFHSLLTGKSFRVGIATKIVDATFMKVTVPSMVPPAYRIAKGVSLVTPNDLIKLSRPDANMKYTVVGAGKTGIDSCLWLLSMGIPPSHIVWIMPRDSWYFDREGCQPGPRFADRRAGDIRTAGECIMAATSVHDLFQRLENSKQLLRLDENVWPTMFRCATVSLAELEQIRKISTIVRKGRVLEIRPDEVVLEQGSYIPGPSSTLYIDCSADGLAKLAPVPVFQGSKIILQSVRICQQVFSAAFIAHIETTYSGDEEKKNALCSPVPHPDESSDYLKVMELSWRNVMKWYLELKTVAWLGRSRLWGLAAMPLPPEESEEQDKAIQETVRQMIMLAHKVTRLLLEETAEEC